MLDESWLVIGQVRMATFVVEMFVAVEVVVVQGNISLGFGSDLSIPSSQLIRQSNARMSKARCERREIGSSLSAGRAHRVPWRVDQ